MDDILKNAIARRDAALAEARRWDEFARMYGELVGSGSHPLVSPDALDPVAKPMPRIRTRSRQGRGPAAQMGGALQETEELAIKIIRDLGRPVPTREMLAEMEKLGFTVGGQDPASTLSARLSRASGLENVRPEGWRVRRKADDDILG